MTLQLDLSSRQERAVLRVFERVFCGAPPFTLAVWEGREDGSDAELIREAEMAFSGPQES